MLEVEGVSKRYARGGVLANDRVDMRMSSGEVVGLLGHNGAGKTTLVHQIMGLLRPTAGRIHLDGADLVERPALARRLCSLQPQGHVPITGLSPRQAIELAGRLRGLPRAQARRRTVELAEHLGIVEWLDRRGAPAGPNDDGLSGGVRRLVAFCMAAAAPARLVILDEPTNDVDPLRRRLLWRAVRQVAGEGTSVLLVTHNVIEAEAAVDRLVLLDRGRVVAQGTPQELKASGPDTLTLDLVWPVGATSRPLPGAGTVTLETERRTVVRIPRAAAGEVFAWADELRRAGGCEEFAVRPATLEDVYVRLLGGDQPPGTSGPAGSPTLDQVRA